MIALSYHELVSVVCLLLLLVFAAGLILSRRSYRRLSKRYDDMAQSHEKLAAELQRLEEQIARQDDFAADLSRAAAANRVHLSRLGGAGDGSSAQMPERYRYVKRLVDSGMGAEAISELLAISSHEAEQLVSLARIAGA